MQKAITRVIGISNRMNLVDFLTVGERTGSPQSISEVYNNPGTIINLIVSNLFILAGIIIFFMIIGAGISFLKDTEKGKDDAKNLLTGAVAGFLIMFGAYWIVQIVKLVTGADIPIEGPSLFNVTRNISGTP